jgi:CubicO group peptidase (beta-lactamase class C family)
MLLNSLFSWGSSVDQKIERWMENQNVPGLAACIVKGDQIVWSKGYGLANIAKRIPFTPDHIFPIASISKTIVATAIMQLRDKGRFKLDDDVNAFLKFPVRNPQHPDRPITFRHLLTHTSSIDDGDALYSLYAVGDPTMSIEEAVTQYFTRGGRFWSRDNFYNHPPGAKERYSNAGFALLGYLVEVISQQPLEDYLQQNIYAPLKMNETSFYISKLDPEKQACQYTYARKQKRHLCSGDGDGNLLPAGVSPSVGYNEHALYSYPTLADGMVRSSVNQLANFMIAMMNGGRFEGAQVLDEKSVNEMLTGSEQGLCWCRTDGCWGHDGSDPGCATEMFFDLRTRVGFIVFVNADVNLEPVKAMLRAKAKEVTS